MNTREVNPKKQKCHRNDRGGTFPTPPFHYSVSFVRRTSSVSRLRPSTIVNPGQSLVPPPLPVRRKRTGRLPFYPLKVGMIIPSVRESLRQVRLRLGRPCPYQSFPFRSPWLHGPGSLRPILNMPGTRFGETDTTSTKEDRTTLPTPPVSQWM